MKNLFVYIAVFFGATTISLLTGVIFSLYNGKTAALVCFIAAAVFFTCFIAAVICGYVLSKKAKKDGSNKENGIDKK